MTAISDKPSAVSTSEGEAIPEAGASVSPAATHHSSFITHHLLPPLPTLTVLQILLFAGIFLMNFFAGTDPDMWWHMATGRYIVENGAIPMTDPFSYTAADQPWIAHEWLADVLMYLLYMSGGYLTSVLFFATLVTLTYWIVFRTLRSLGLGIIATSCVTFWVAFMSLGGWNVRPQVFSYLFFALYLHLLVRSRTHSDRWLWLVPGVMVAWVNLHAGYIMGLVLLGLFLAGEGMNFLRARRVTAAGDSKSEAKAGLPTVLSTQHPELRTQNQAQRPAAGFQTYMLTAAATILATVANPQGLGMLLYPFTYAGTQNASMKYINEWQSPNFHDYFFFIFGASMMVLMLLPGKGKPDWALGLPLLVLTAMSLQSVRVIFFYAIAAAPMLGLRLASPKTIDQSRRPGTRWNWAVLAVCLAALASTLYLSDRTQLGPEPRTKDYPAPGLRYIREAGLNGNLFNTYHWGGFLAWSLYPERKVFIDGRADMYGDQFMEKYKKVYTARRDWEEVLDEYQVEVVLVEKESPIASVLAATGKWSEAFRGEAEAVFVKTP